MRAFLPGQPGLEPVDPLRAFLLGLGRPVFPESPPWVRLFLGSVEGPDPARWRFVHEPCRGCGVPVCFGLQACPRPWVFAACALCMACGYVVVGYAARGGAVESAEGGAWAPPCPAAGASRGGRRSRDPAPRRVAVTGIIWGMRNPPPLRTACARGPWRDREGDEVTAE